MSERRQLALMLAGLVVLVAVGFVGATLFPEDCEGLDQVGELSLVLADAADALPLTAGDAELVQQLGEAAGIGPWRGAVALPDQAVVTPSEFGFFVVTDDAFTVLRPAFGIASAARGRVGLDVIPAGTSLALRAADGETGVFNGEYELDRCGRLPPDAAVLAMERGIAVLGGAEAAVITLSGDELFRAPAAGAAHVVEDTVVLGDGSSLELRSVRGGEVLDRIVDLPQVAPGTWLDAAADRLLLPAGDGLLPVVVGATSLDPQDPVPVPLSSVVDAVTTPAGVVAIGPSVDAGGQDAVATDRSPRSAPFPAGVSVASLHGSPDGHVGVVVEVDGTRALLVYGRDIDE